MVECRMDYVYLYLSGTASTAIKVKGLSFKGLFKIIKISKNRTRTFGLIERTERINIVYFYKIVDGFF